MNWFPGSYTLACQVSKKNKALLVVFVDDGSENSQMMSYFWSQMSQTDFFCPVVAVHFKTGDPAFKQFNYPTPVLPATYFIDETSAVLKIVTLPDADSEEAFFTLVQDIVDMFKAKNAPSEPSPPVQEASVSEQSLSLDEKVKRAKDLLEKKRNDDEEKKKSEEKAKEMDRIRSGKLMQEAAQKRQEQELIESAAQRRREKLQAEAEKERVRAQIRADREEREYRQQLGAQQSVETSQPAATETRTPLRVESDRCRVQVRLPENQSVIEEFSSGDKLAVLVDALKKSGLVHGSFNIVQPYPRHVFTAEEMKKTFLDLCLTPSCTLAIEQEKSISSQVARSNPIGLFSYLFSLLILSPLNYVFVFVRNLFGGAAGRAQSKKEDPPAGTRRTPSGPGGDAAIRRRGNISSLGNRTADDNDDNASWNGNSTQYK